MTTMDPQKLTIIRFIWNRMQSLRGAEKVSSRFRKCAVKSEPTAPAQCGRCASVCDEKPRFPVPVRFPSQHYVCL